MIQMTNIIKDKATYTPLEKEAVYKYSNYTFENFNSWINELSKKEKLSVWKVLNLGIYNEEMFNNIEYITKYMPEEVEYIHENAESKTSHRFRFQINIEKGEMIVGYKHFLSEDINQEIGGQTDIWCNPFEGNKITDYLVEKSANAINFHSTLISIYEFLIENNIVK
mgnify:CR=1 FL=1